MKYKADQMGIPEHYFAGRWLLDFGPFSIRLHKWIGTDDPDALHDHGQWFITICLWGGYTDISTRPMTEPNEDRKLEHRDVLRPGSIRFRPATYTHTVQEVKNPTYTLTIFGKPSRRWSFFDRKSGRKMKRDKYFAEVGHHTANGERIRLRPDGSRI